MKRLFLLLALATLLAGSVRADSSLNRLRVNDLDAPIGLDAGDVANLRFSWEITSPQRGFTQTAWQILVASSPETLADNRGDLWDSGKTVSANQNGLAYAGQPLAGKTAYWWKARIWGGDGTPGDWSQPVVFETGIVDADRDWSGQFVGGIDPAQHTSFNLIRREFRLPPGKTILRARAYVAAEVLSRSYWDFYVNGRRPSDAVNFRKDYSTFDLTALLHPGDANAVGVMIGDRGNQPKSWLCDVDVWFTDGTRLTVGTDKDCQGFTGGPVVSARELDGENYDARLEAAVAGWDDPGFSAAGWRPVRILAGTKRPDRGHESDAVRIHETIPAVALTEPAPGVHIFDLGRNISGWARLTVQGRAGTTLTLRYAERVKADGTLDRSSNLVGIPAEAVDHYTLKGGGPETWEPYLTYHGFRYVEVTGDAALTTASLEGRWIHSDILHQATEFACSDPLLNREFDAFRTGELDNSMYFHTDCNQRGERAPWSADAYACSAASLALFDSADFWQRWIRLSNRMVGPHGESGAVLNNPGGYSLLWQAQCVFIPWDFHQARGDLATLPPAYDRARQFADCIINWFDTLDEVVCQPGQRNKAEVVSHVDHHDWLINVNEPWKTVAGKKQQNGFWPWGDWCHPGKMQDMPDMTALNSMYYFECLNLVVREAKLLGHPEDAAQYAAVAAKVKAAVNARFLTPNGNRHYPGNRQALNALALDIGIVPDECRAAVAQSLADDIRARTNHLDTGVVGTLHLLRALTDTGHDDAALAVARQTTFPSWGFMLEAPQAPGTFWENWENANHSKNHPFLGGALATWLLESVAGIRPSQPGYAEIEFKPCAAAVGQLTAASATLPTVRGPAAIRWSRQAGVIDLAVTVPANSRARIYVSVPGGNAATATVREGGRVLWQNGTYVPGVAGVATATAGIGAVIVNTGSGQYQFSAQ